MRFVSVVFVRHHNVPGAAAATLGSLDKGKKKLSIWKIVQVQSLRIRLQERAYLMNKVMKKSEIPDCSVQ